jgi:LEA14-like dessication related protein
VRGKVRYTPRFSKPLGIIDAYRISMKKTFVILAAGLTLLGAAACASLGRGTFQEPVVTFRDLQLQGVGLTGGTLDVILGVYNPNRFDLSGTRLTYRLLVDTTAIGEGVYSEKFTVQHGDTTVIRLPVSLSYSGLSAAGKQLMGKGSVDYRVMGDVTVSTALGDFTRPYSQTGRFTTFGGAKR